MAIRVLVVDDSALMRKLLSRILGANPRIQVVGTASDGHVAGAKVAKLHPDVITLDFDMPRVDGLTFLASLMRQRPTPVVMVSSFTRKGAEATLRALELGAVDFVAKPALEDAENIAKGRAAEELVEKVIEAAGARLQALGRVGEAPAIRTRQEPPPGEPWNPTGPRSVRLVAVGASTGGTEAIRSLVAALPRTTPPILVVQHLPKHFTPGFAQSLDSQSRLSVREAEDGMPVRAGELLVAPGDRHLLVERSGPALHCRLSNAPPVNRHRPSVDVLFASAARELGRGAAALLLTGMGKDGAEGLLALRKAGAFTIAQDRASSVVWGMPGHAVELGAARAVLDLGGIASWLVSLVGEPVRALPAESS